MADKQKLEGAVRAFEQRSKVSRNDHETCTVAELNNALKQIAALARAIISELPND